MLDTTRWWCGTTMVYLMEFAHCSRFVFYCDLVLVDQTINNWYCSKISHNFEIVTWPSRTLHWRHNDQDGVSNHQPRVCLLNCLFRRRSKKTSKLRVTGLCVGNSPGPVNSPHKGPVTRKMFSFDDVIMKNADEFGDTNHLNRFGSHNITTTKQSTAQWYIHTCMVYTE